MSESETKHTFCEHAWELEFNPVPNMDHRMQQAAEKAAQHPHGLLRASGDVCVGAGGEDVRFHELDGAPLL